MENSNHLVNILDNFLVEDEHQFEKNKELFQNIKFQMIYLLNIINYQLKVLLKIIQKNNNLNENQKDNKNKENIVNLFKSKGILLKEPTDFYFYYLSLSKKKKIKVLKEKSVKYLERIKDFLINDSKAQNIHSRNKNEKNFKRRY